MPYRGIVYRIDAGASGQPVGTAAYYDKLSGTTTANGATINAEQLAVYGVPLVLQCCTIKTGVSTVADYPNDGTGAVRDGSSTTSVIHLAADLPITDIDFPGMLLAFISGPCNGQVSVIQSMSTRDATVSPTFSTAPTSGSYLILLDTLRMGQLHVKTEISASAVACGVSVSLFDYGRNLAPSPADRALRRLADSEMSIANLGYTTNAEQSGYYHGATFTTDVRGGFGAKIRLTTAPTTGTVAIYAGAT